MNKLALDVYEDLGEMETFMEGNWSKIRNQSLLALDEETFPKYSKADK